VVKTFIIIIIIIIIITIIIIIIFQYMLRSHDITGHPIQDPGSKLVPKAH
jgi:uncharacterized alpha/beta hydrolase family protein